ncbi:MAG: DUF1501 domain-containing protein [Acidimicrobiia bacterium]
MSDETDPAATQIPSMHRRRFLKVAGIGAGVTLGAAGWLRDTSGSGSNNDAAATSDSTLAARDTRPATAAPAGNAKGKAGTRRLVVVELDGGNDGMSMLVPAGLGRYRDLRPRTAIADDQLIELDGAYGLHKNLGRLHKRGLAMVQGVGSMEPDGSHFAMMQRWWAGDAVGGAALRGGFFGRLADQLGDPAAAAVGVSIGSGSHPALASERVTTMSLPSPDAAGYLFGASPDDVTRSMFQREFLAMMQEGDLTQLTAARRAGASAVAFARTLTALGEAKGDYPGSNLGNGLRLAASLLAADPNVRIVHVPAGLDFDTHEDHLGRHPALLDDMDASIDALLADLDDRGMGDDVLVMTISEFGRTAKDNGSNGLDHGTASVAMLAGPVKAGLYGEPSSLDKLSDNDQLVATMGLDQYYATIAEKWFDVPASEVLPGSPKAVDLGL